MRVLSFDPQIKSAHRGFQAQANRIMSSQHKSYQFSTFSFLRNSKLKYVN